MERGSWRLRDIADVAQLVEHSLGKGEVTGSIPVIGSRFLAVRYSVLESWRTMKWTVLAVFAIYAFLQVIALKYLDGRRRKRSQQVMAGIYVAGILLSFANLIFGFGGWSRVGGLALGFLSSTGILVLSQRAGVTQW